MRQIVAAVFEDFLPAALWPRAVGSVAVVTAVCALAVTIVRGRPDGRTADELTVYQVQDGRITNIAYVEQLAK